MQLAKGAGAKIRLLGASRTLQTLEAFVQNQDRYTVDISYELLENWDNFTSLTKEVTKNDLLTVILGRPHTISYRPEFHVIPRYLSRYFEEVSYLLLYPEQKG
jgi:hypothetical protein